MSAAQGIRLTQLDQTCTACPAQWDAWDEDGTYYYVRYRWGYLRVEKSPSRDDWWNGNFEEVYGENQGDSLDGFLTTDEMLAATGMVLVGKAL